MTDRIVLGLDGGGTSTRAVLATALGDILGSGRAGPSNYDDVGIAKAGENIGLAVKQAWTQAGIAPRPAAAVFLGMAGVVSASDRSVIHEIAAGLHLADSVEVDHDLRIAWAGGLALNPGIALIAGTGSSCYGRTADGSSCRVGGWGHLLDDGGSSYFLGLEAIRAVVRSVDGRLGSTALLEPILTTLEVQDAQEIMGRIYHPPMSRAEIAGLAPLVLKVAQKGDEIAQGIVREGQKELAQLVSGVAQQLNFPAGTAQLTVTGGLAQSGDFFKESLYSAINAQVQGVTIREPLLSPVLGAVLLALQLSSESISEDVISKFKEHELVQE